MTNQKSILTLVSNYNMWSCFTQLWFLLQMQKGPVEDWNQSRFTKTSMERIHAEWHMEAASQQILCFICSISLLCQARLLIAQSYENTPVWVRAVRSPIEGCSGMRWKKLRWWITIMWLPPCPFSMLVMMAGENSRLQLHSCDHHFDFSDDIPADTHFPNSSSVLNIAVRLGISYVT